MGKQAEVSVSAWQQPTMIPRLQEEEQEVVWAKESNAILDIFVKKEGHQDLIYIPG
jgi:hypothetical protein